jgi:ketosteroid isomerase-like protein
MKCLPQIIIVIALNASAIITCAREKQLTLTKAQAVEDLSWLRSALEYCHPIGQPAEKADTVKQQLQKLSDLLTRAEANDDTKSFLAFYDENVISMPEYQPMMRGINEVRSFYTEIFERQDVKSYRRQTEEVIHVGNTIIEIGTFRKEYALLKSDTILTLNGKYCNIWNVRENGGLKIKGEIFGFFHPVDSPQHFVVNLQTRAGESEIYPVDQVPIELRAYNALMEKYVKNGEGALRSQFFTDDGKFMPFAHPTVTGMNELKPYLVAYDTHGEGFKFDSISVYTYYYEYFDGYVLEYPKFKVKWSTPTSSGRAEGKNVRIWKRQKDRSLKLYLEISTHDYLH